MKEMIILVTVIILSLTACEKEVVSEEIPPTNPPVSYSSSNCNLNSLEGIWVKTHLTDENNIDINPSDILAWGLHYNDTLNFTQTSNLLNQPDIMDWYYTTQKDPTSGGIYQLMEQDCQLNVGVMCCGVYWVNYHITHLSETEITLDFNTDPSQQDPPSLGSFMELSEEDAHIIHYRRMPY